MTCSFCAVALPTLCFLQNPSFAFKRNSARRKPIDNGPSDLCGPLPYCARAGEATRAPSCALGSLPLESSFILRSPIHLLTSKKLPPPIWSGGARTRAVTGRSPTAAILSPGGRGTPAAPLRPGTGEPGFRGGPAAPFMEERGGSAARTVSSSSPSARRRLRRSPSQARLPRRAPPAAAGPGPAGIGAGGCDGRAGWGRSGRAAAAAAAFSCAGPEGSAARAAVRALREEGRASASPPLRVRQPSAVGVGERRSAQAGGRARPRRLAGRWSEAARLEEDGRWRRRRRLQRQLVSGRCVHGWQGESGPWAAFPSGNRRGARYGLGDGGRRVSVCVCIGGEERVPLGGRRQWEVPRWRGGRVGAVKGDFVW